MNQQAHPDDVLIVGALVERSAYPQFTDRQVVSMGNPHRLRGRYVRRAYWTSPALCHRNYPEMLAAIGPLAECGQLHIDTWKPEEQPTLVDQIIALPEDNASSSRDFGRGYAKAIDDVMSLLVPCGLVPVDAV